MNFKISTVFKTILNFINNAAHFRFFVIGVLFCNIRDTFPILHYSLMGVAIIWSLYLFITKLLIQKGLTNIRYRHMIYLFLGGALLTCLWRFPDHLLGNLYSVCVMAICFFFFYGVHAEKSNRRVKKEMIRLLNVIIFVSTVLMAVGLILLLIFPKGLVLNGSDFVIHENRFVGLIGNANVNAFYAVMAFVSCHILFRIGKTDGTMSSRRTVYYLLCAAVNIIAVFLTDSNDTLLFLITYFSFLIFFQIFKDFNRKKIHHILLRLAAVMLAAVVVISAFVSIRIITQNSVSLMITAGESRNEISSGIKKEVDGTVTIQDDTERENDTNFKHENKNIDSGRFTLWRQAFSIVEKYPILGIGKANILQYGDEVVGKLKSVYIGDIRYVDFHNGLITILVCYGLVGLNLFIVLAITIAKAMFKGIFKHIDSCQADGNVLALITAFCSAYCVYSMFEVALMVDDSYRVVIFWAMIGFALSYAMKYRRHTAYVKDFKEVKKDRKKSKLLTTQTPALEP